METSKKWVIAFESGALLAKEKMQLTFFHSSALTFDSRSAADAFLTVHAKEIYEVGLNPSVREIDAAQIESQRRMYHSGS